MTTATVRQSKRSSVVTVLLLLGLAGLWIGPMGCGNDAGEPSTQEPTSQNSSGRTILLNVGFVDKTDARPPSEQFLFETPRSAQWTPGALEGGFITKAFEKYPVGETNKLLLYPVGQAGPRLEVPFTMKPDMSSVLASSRTNVTVYDDRVVVTGPAVPDERMEFDRPSAPSE